MSQSVRIRRLTVADLDSARALRLESLLDSPMAFGSLYEDTLKQPDEWWQTWISGGATFAASDTSGDVGIVRVQALDEHPDDVAMLYSMWVAPRARGRGVGEALVRECVQWARHVGFNDVQLAVVENNERAVQLYVRCGFRRTGRVEVRERDGVTIAEMSLAIASD